jgi:hypothetical protein
MTTSNSSVTNNATASLPFAASLTLWASNQSKSLNALSDAAFVFDEENAFCHYSGFVHTSPLRSKSMSDTTQK